MSNEKFGRNKFGNKLLNNEKLVGIIDQIEVYIYG